MGAKMRTPILILVPESRLLGYIQGLYGSVMTKGSLLRLVEARIICCAGSEPSIEVKFT